MEKQVFVDTIQNALDHREKHISSNVNSLDYIYAVIDNTSVAGDESDVIVVCADDLIQYFHDNYTGEKNIKIQPVEKILEMNVLSYKYVLFNNIKLSDIRAFKDKFSTFDGTTLSFFDFQRVLKDTNNKIPSNIDFADCHVFITDPEWDIREKWADNAEK